MAERKLKPYFKDGKLPVTAWRREHDRLEQEYATGQAELSPIYAEVKKLWQIKYKVDVYKRQDLAGGRGNCAGGRRMLRPERCG